jgi:hypothetical protein
LTFGT